MGVFIDIYPYDGLGTTEKEAVTYGMKVSNLRCKSQGLTPRNPLAYEVNNSDTCKHANMVVSFECSNHYMAAVIKKS